MKTESVKGYKAFNQDLTCRDFQYAIGETYTINGIISMCQRGFHFCRDIPSCFNYYDRDSRVCEIKAEGEVIRGDDKSVCSTITIVKELTAVEINRGIYGNGDGNGNGNGNGYGNGNGNGYGYGDGNGYGYGDGNGYGYGDGDGYGNGNGYGYGDGDGYGNGNGNGIQRVLTYQEG